MKSRVILYSLLIAICALAAMTYGYLADGQEISAKRIVAALLIVPVFGYLIWLRWDWAVPRGRKIRAERDARQKHERETTKFEGHGVDQ